MRSIKQDFIRENVRGKIAVITEAAESDDEFTALCLFSLRFIRENYGLLSSETDFIELAAETIKRAYAHLHTDIPPLLEHIFKITENRTLQNGILENFAFSAVSAGFYPEDSAVQTFNSYTQNLFSAGTQTPEDLQLLTAAVNALGKLKNPSSFPVLFSCYASENKTLSDAAAGALNSFAGIYEKSVRAVIVSGTAKEKRLALDLILNNPANSDFFKAEMSENALTQLIKQSSDTSGTPEDKIALKMRSVRELYRVSWTRSADLMREVFIGARAEYEAGVLTDNQFIEIMYAFARLASTEAASHLSAYLKDLNKNREENKSVSTPVVLALIQSLQILGDKTAFDDLLYATYQDYPEEVIAAARDALSKLKW